MQRTLGWQSVTRSGEASQRVAGKKASEPPARPRLPRGGPALPAPVPGNSLNAGGGGAGTEVASRPMDLRRLGAGEWLTGVSGVALLVSLFLPWYDPGASAWESLAAIDVLLALVAASGVLLAIVTAAQRVPAVPIALSALVTLVGVFGVVLVLFRLLDLPDGAVGRDWAIWLGLTGAVGIVAGAVIAMRDEVRPGAAVPDIPAMPAPGP